MRHTLALTLAAFLLFTSAAHAQTPPPAGAYQVSPQQAFEAARTKAHEHADKLSKMTEDQWLAHKTAHPGKHNSESLSQARMKAYKHAEKLDHMTLQQYENQQARHHKPF